MSLKQINTRAKSLRRARPGMSWHAAQKAAAASLRKGTTHRKKRTTSTAVARTVHHKRKRAVGSTTIVTGRKKRKKKTGFFGATAGGSMQSRMGQIAEIAFGFGVGAVGVHMVLRPLEHKVAQHFPSPYVAKAMPWAEIALGGLMFITGKYKILRHVGLGVMGAGVHGAMKQLPIHMHSPAETISGLSGSMVSTKIPINGTVRERIAGLIQKEGYTQTPVVGRSILLHDNGGPVRTPTVGLMNNVYSTPTVGDYDPDDELLFRTNHFAR